MIFYVNFFREMIQMFIRLFSDLHYEFTFREQHKTRHVNDPYPEFWEPTPLDTDKDTVLVLAGDLYTGTRSIPIIKKYHDRFKAVLLVLGNHDYYGYDMNTLPDEYKGTLSFYGMDNVFLLDESAVEIDDVLFVGATLWTTMNNEDPLTTIYAKSTMSPDFNNIRYDGERLSVKNWLDTNKQHYDYIRNVVQNNKDKKICVITHHGCTFSAVDAKYKDESFSNGYFFSEYDYLIENNTHIKYWMHGHTHSKVNLVLGETTVIANPHGYPVMGGKENSKFDEISLWEI